MISRPAPSVSLKGDGLRLVDAAGGVGRCQYSGHRRLFVPHRSTRMSSLRLAGPSEARRWWRRAARTHVTGWLAPGNSEAVFWSVGERRRGSGRGVAPVVGSRLTRRYDQGTAAR
jgi:hypothetical protein